MKKPVVKDESAQVIFESREFTKPFHKIKGWEERTQQHIWELVKSKRCFFRLSCHPTKSITVPGIRSILDSWTRDDWLADVVCIDYADIIAPVDRKEQRLEQVKGIWEQLRALSQSLHCLLVTATQVNREGYSKLILDRANTSEDHRKLAEVTAMIGINQTADEKESQVYRLNYIARREGDYSVRRCCHVASCLALSNPAVLSVW